MVRNNENALGLSAWEIATVLSRYSRPEISPICYVSFSSLKKECNDFHGFKKSRIHNLRILSISADSMLRSISEEKNVHERPAELGFFCGWASNAPI